VSRIDVLIVDDHQMFRDSIVRALRDESDIEVVGAAGSIAELDGLTHEHADVVVMDMYLPDGDGIEGTRLVLERDPASSVLLLTGQDDDRIGVRAIEAGCMGFLTKTSGVAQLVEAVRSLAAGDAYVSADLLARLLPRVGRTDLGVGSDLTPRELEVLRHAAAGGTNQSLGAALYLSVNTVRNHVQSAILKLGAHSKLEAVTIALREGLIDLPDRR
jgi:two-component system nitrate/nitrite response regulator NarL